MNYIKNNPIIAYYNIPNNYHINFYFKELFKNIAIAIIIIKVIVIF